ncbi:hypothetical protein ACH46L_03495 [Streptomyces althioticus]|uniref:TRADD-N-associated membrane domain-containing protein n=1 Tax=Streptomyces althioticus TaxID=83380 RepID=UPI0037969241
MAITAAVGGVLAINASTGDLARAGYIAASVGAGLAITAMAVSLANRESPDISASRERVREAEREVEGALRGMSVHLPEFAPLTPSLEVRVPGRATGDTEEPQPADDTTVRQERRDLALSTLWRLTHAQLELYHKIATSQAKRSFFTAQASMILGFGMLAAFVYLALKVSNMTGAIVAGGLGAVSAALAGFISKTFVKSQQTAADHLRAYFDQPLEFSRYLAAERLLADASLPEEKRAEVVAALVQTVAAGPGGPAPAADPRALLEQLQDLAPGQQ